MKPTRPVPASTIAVLGCFVVQWLVMGLFGLFVLENEVIARTFVSSASWQALLKFLGGTIEQTPDGLLAVASLGGIGLASFLGCAGVNFFGAVFEKWRGHERFYESFARTCLANAFWTLPVFVWTIGWMISLLFPQSGLASLLVQTVRMALAVTLAGWLWETVRASASCVSSSDPSQENSLSQKKGTRIVLAGMLVYVIVFTAMNWGLWWNLQLPHGDSSMYEEHLWNVLHGKGFRSYLDQGLFLGEHLQVIHLLLLPLYALWPSHLLLELCESIALALGALPVFWMARRHGSSQRAAVLVALAYLLYFPMHYLDISIDLKTFRPSSFGIPALLFMLNAAERRRWGWMSFCLLLALSCQEDFGVVIAPFGVWLLADAWWRSRTEADAVVRGQVIAGGIIALAIPAYVIFAVKFAIPWFHEGATVHYASYFQAFGKTPVEIVTNILTKPGLLWGKLMTAASVALFLDLLMPLGMPLRAWRRLLVGLPLFVLLCLNELTQDFPGPFHHFHAALIPILLWATCSTRNTQDLSKVSSTDAAQGANRRGLWIFCCAAMTSVFFSLSPVGISFWDPGSPFFWQRLYIQDERAKEFAKIPPLIPIDSRVASTDFIHPRFTHYERSYDYSHYPRRVANYEDKVPDDTDYIVIDTGHRYSEIQRFEQMREYKHQRDQWEVVPVDTHGFFIVLKRIKYPNKTKSTQP